MDDSCLPRSCHTILENLDLLETLCLSFLIINHVCDNLQHFIRNERFSYQHDALGSLERPTAAEGPQQGTKRFS